MSFGALAFLSPWLLAGLATLPLIYWLLRTTPPLPKRVTFPATRILADLENREKTPAKTPWWLLLLRLLAAALIILALADPILNPERQTTLKGSGPLVIVVDNGWAAAPGWDDRKSMIDRLINMAEAQSRPVMILPTAGTAAKSAKIEAPAAARTTARALEPLPFPPVRVAAGTALQELLAATSSTNVNIVWLSDGVDHKGHSGEFAEQLASAADGGTFAVVSDPSSTTPLGLEARVSADGGLEARVLRAGGGAKEGRLDAYSARSELLGTANFTLSQGERSQVAEFDLPLELRNQVTRIAISAQQSAGAVSLLDARARRQRVGLISGESREQAQPLLAPFYYIEKALGPTAEIVKPKDKNVAAGIEDALKQNASVLVLADIGTLTDEARDATAAWVEKGGLLVRFAGPRLEKGGDDLLPVPLRIGGRTLGGALSWSTPQKLNPFADTSLFAGLEVPEDVTIRRQVLADPARIGDQISVWARLEDGTPLVTAAKRGDGLVVLFHITANTDWSNVPISGLFVDMLNRIISLGRLGGPASGEISGAAAVDAAQGASEAGTLSPFETLDGFGQPGPPPPTARAIPVGEFGNVVASSDHPPGYYGSSGAPRALNVIRPETELNPLPALPSSATRMGFSSAEAQPLKPWLLAIAMALILLDMIAVLLMQGGASLLRGGGNRVRASLLVVGLLTATSAIVSLPSPTFAQAGSSVEARALQATGDVTFGYVITGNARVDETSRIGLAGLARVLKLRTAVIPGEPMPVNIVTDEISFFPVLYWPVQPDADPLPEKTLAKIDAYMKQGGMIIFDTRDQGTGMPSGLPSSGRAQTPLQAIVGKLDIPRLEPVPEGHVLTKSFYLLRQFPGRWDGGQLWVEAGGVPDATAPREARRADGVTSILITSNDFASAWALDPRGRPLYPTVPGGEIQREMAFRTGINIVMHALTGNYKADQVHVPALLERLGQ